MAECAKDDRKCLYTYTTYCDIDDHKWIYQFT